MEPFCREWRSTNKLSKALATQIIDNIGERELDDIYSLDDDQLSENSDLNGEKNLTTTETSENSEYSYSEEEDMQKNANR